MIRITQKQLFFLLILLLFVSDVVMSIHMPLSWIRSIISFGIMLILPGLLLVLSTRIRNISLWEYLLFSIGGSVSFFLISGLFLNQLYPHNPLSFWPLFGVYNAFCFILLLVSYLRNTDIEIPIRLPMHVIDMICVAVGILSILLSVFGAISLNNNGSNILTMSMLLGIAGFLPFIILFRKYISSGMYPYLIFCFSIAFLLMLSLRSGHIVGWDIHDEFRVFSHTLTHHQWIVEKGNAYNACLSITILPTIFTVLTGVPPEQVFTILMQLLFACVPVAAFFLTKKQLSPPFAFLAIFYVIEQPFFIQPMTGLIRQEIALLFFILLLFTMFHKRLEEGTKRFFIIVFGLSMVLSHYSTTYIAIAVLLVAWIATVLIKQIQTNSLGKKILQTLHITLWDQTYQHAIYLSYIFLFFFTTFLWYSQISQTSANLQHIIKDTITNTRNIFSSEVRNEETSQPLQFLPTKNTSQTKIFAQYEEAQKNTFYSPPEQLYPKEAYATYQAHLVPTRDAAPLINTTINSYLTLGFAGIKALMKGLVLLGILYLVWLFIKEKTTFRNEYALLALTSMTFITVMLVHPTLGHFYNLSRIYIQILFIGSFTAVLGAVCLVRLITRRYYPLPIAIVFALGFLLYSGVTNQLFGGSAVLHLQNFGEDYNKFYLQQQEIASTQWLQTNRDTDAPIFADEITNLTFHAFSNTMSAVPTVLPTVITKSGYVYVRFVNLQSNRADADFAGQHLAYTFPVRFLQEHKNLVYTNGKSQIFK